VITKTGEYIRADYIDHRNRITEIARNRPSRADSMDCEYSYLQRQLRRKEMVRFFTTAAVGEYAGKWLPWILRNIDAFRVLFDGKARNISGAGEIFAEWYAEQVVFSTKKKCAFGISGNEGRGLPLSLEWNSAGYVERSKRCK